MNAQETRQSRFLLSRKVLRAACVHGLAQPGPN